jgi:formylmethanofuran dehydrogenase subunit E-like metal-binding protein
VHGLFVLLVSYAVVANLCGQESNLVKKQSFRFTSLVWHGIIEYSVEIYANHMYMMTASYDRRV